MQTFATSVHSVSNFATQKAELHICPPQQGTECCTGSAGLRAAARAARAAGQVPTTCPGSQTHTGMKQEPTQPENSTAEGVLAKLWMSQDCVGREARERKNNRETKQKTFFGLSWTTLWDPPCMFPLGRKQRKDGVIPPSSL